MPILHRKRLGVAVKVVYGTILFVAFQNCSPYRPAGRLDSSSQSVGIDQAVTAGPFTCDSAAAPAPTSMRRLTKPEYINTLKALLSKQSVSDQSAILAAVQPFLDTIPEDTGSKFTRADSTIDQEHISGYFYVAQKLGEVITASNARSQAFFGTCASTADLSTTCLSSFLGGNAVKVFRRPLSSDETSQIQSDFTSYVAGSRNAALITRMLTSVNFLMLVEANGTEIYPGLLQVSPYELASRLSYHFLSTMPDDQLLAAAADGSLMQDSVLRAQVNRLTGGSNSAQVQASISEFYSQWLGLGTLASPENSTGAVFAAFANGASLTKASMQQEIQDMTYYYTFTVPGTFNDLLTSPYSFAKNQDLADIYGVGKWNGDASNMISLPQGQRSGLLTRAAFLANGATVTNPVQRGVKIRRNILCDDLPPPPASIANMLRIPPADPTMTTRERYEHKTDSPLCMSCHTNINPLGFALESFDSLGRFRTTEKILDDTTGALLAEKAVDAVVAPYIFAADKRVSTDAVQFSQMVADSGKAQKCFVQSYFYFTYRQPADVTQDGCALEDMRQSLMGTDGSLKKMFLNAPFSKAFKLKRLAP